MILRNTEMDPGLKQKEELRIRKECSHTLINAINKYVSISSLPIFLSIHQQITKPHRGQCILE